MKNLKKAPDEVGEETEEVTVNLAAAKEMSVNAWEAAVLSELEEQRTALKDFTREHVIPYEFC